MSLLTDEYVIIDKAGDMHRGRLSKASQDVIKDKLIALIGDDIPDTGIDDYTSDVWNEVNKRLRQKVNDL